MIDLDVVSALFGIGVVGAALVCYALATTFTTAFRARVDEIRESKTRGPKNDEEIPGSILAGVRTRRLSELAEKQAGLFDQQAVIMNAYRMHLDQMMQGDAPERAPVANNEVELENNERPIVSAKDFADHRAVAERVSKYV
jgi:hypothetical protein